MEILKKAIVILLFLLCYPIDSRRIRHTHHNHYKPRTIVRDSLIADELSCAPIPPVFLEQLDVAAKIKPQEGVCKPDEYLSPVSLPLPWNLPSDPSLRTLSNSPDDPYSCGEHKPCGNNACCGKSGYCGWGPKYCGTNGQSPNDVCWSNCGNHAECGRHSKTGSQTCPLNVCCSAFGFCGMTEEFCKKTSDESTSCQSNCDQPTSGGSESNSQRRVIGYYEAWNAHKRCIGMGMQDIPVGSLTHIYYSFGYIRPETFEIIPMNDNQALSEDSFKEFTNLKSKNTALKTVIALGGWTFNDNNTIWQPVFGDLSSTEDKRSRFIGNVIDFMARWGFDGVDIDWEYPGAGDRGGNPDDGVNLTKLLKEMREKFDQSGNGDKEISFTVPTSYWYMRHFDIKASSEVANYVNLMAYDLHGVWDGGTSVFKYQMFAHSNLTDIKRAMDLLWRNHVDPGKVNMGIGFYGRSFQLADPSCNTPGCLFQAGGKPGSCTDQSGYLSFAEIAEIIDKNGLVPIHSEEDAVKWISWDHDQWVSYDDKDTLQQKVKFANSIGIGGLLIWAIDLDSPQLDALAGLIFPERLGAKGKGAKAVDKWHDMSEGGHCSTTECGVTTCKQFELRIGDPVKCDDDTSKQQVVCCPLSSAPNPKKCKWRGTAPLCSGQCERGEVALRSSKYGDGKKCNDGRKFFCCEAEANVPSCRWAELGTRCTSDENELTWSLVTLVDRSKTKQYFCCSKEEQWENCAWHGIKSGSCFDNHCDTGWQVALTMSDAPEAHHCNPIYYRQATFCCEPANKKSPFLPVPLEYLFPDPPPREEADVEFELKTDPTYGGTKDASPEDSPSGSPFGFVVLTSPDEIQTSLDKRDGSHWEVFDCHEAMNEGEHTVRMMCTDLSSQSNCHRIHLGHGAVGTIVEMPEGCGPGKYAVVKRLQESAKQELPHALVKRGITHIDTIYDLTFDYDFSRVPRDMGNTQMRIDVSNEPNYWDNVVNKAASNRQRLKRGLPDVGGNHKRWLEEQWRDDYHFGGLSKDEIHKRWFGDDIVAWLKQLLEASTSDDPITVDPVWSHTYQDELQMTLVDERRKCPALNLEAHLKIAAKVKVDAAVNYGFTLIATIGGPGQLIDLSNSYLYFRTKGEVVASLTLEAMATIRYDSQDFLVLSGDKFGAAFSVPGIVTIGPNFKLYVRLLAEATIAAKLEARVKVADWDVHQTYPAINSEWTPKTAKEPKRDGTQALGKPEFSYGVSAQGHLTAYLKPGLTFGIDFNKKFLSVGSCAVNLFAESHVRFHAEAQAGNQGASACFGIDAGASLYATVEAPKSFNWFLPQSIFPIASVRDVELYKTCAGNPGLSQISMMMTNETISSSVSPQVQSLSRRGEVLGKCFEDIGISCPQSSSSSESCASCKKADGGALLCSYEPREPDDEMEDVCMFQDGHLYAAGNSDTKIQGAKELTFYGNEKAVFNNYPSCGVAINKGRLTDYYILDHTASICDPTVRKYPNNKFGNAVVTEHIYEAQTLVRFFQWLVNKDKPGDYSNTDWTWIMNILYNKPKGVTWSEPNLWEQLITGIGSDNNLDGLVLADKRMNHQKCQFFRQNQMNPKKGGLNLNQVKTYHADIASVFSYMGIGEIWTKFVDSSQKIETVLKEFDEKYDWKTGPTRPSRASNQPRAGLRDLYCYFIDEELGAIERRVEVWHPLAADHVNKLPNGAQWAANDMGPNGPIALNKLRFPHSPQQHSAPSSSTPKVWAQSNYKSLWKHGPAGPF